MGFFKQYTKKNNNSSSSSDSTSKTDSSSVSNSSSDSSSEFNLLDEFEMRSIKIIDVGYIAIIYFIFAILCSALFDRILGEWNEENDKKKSLGRLSLELIGLIWVIGVVTYIVRNVVELIPSPLSLIPLSNPKRKFEHKKLKELTSAAFFTLIFLGTSFHFKRKLEYFHKRLTENLKKENFTENFNFFK